jgi:hypothetical protein
VDLDLQGLKINPKFDKETQELILKLLEPLTWPSATETILPSKEVDKADWAHLDEKYTWKG